MIKTYKHKTLGWIAEGGEDMYFIRISDYEKKYIKETFITIPKELLENSDDWVEIEEDWIDDFWNSIPDDPCISEIKRSIKKHMPKITEGELLFCRGDNKIHWETYIKFKKLLKQKGLMD